MEECEFGHFHESGPAQFLVENISLLPRGRALDIAMGSGRNAIYLAENGFQVEGVDNDTVSISRALEQARDSGVTIQAISGDLEKDYQIKPGLYDLIICFNYLHRPVFPSIKAGLKPGGVLVYETFIVDQVHFGRPHNPDFLLKYNELLDLCRDLRCLRYREGIFDDNRAIASLLAVRQGG